MNCLQKKRASRTCPSSCSKSEAQLTHPRPHPPPFTTLLSHSNYTTHASNPNLSTETSKMKRNIVIFLIILILFILIALIAYLIYYLQTRMAVGGTATSSGSDMTSVA